MSYPTAPEGMTDALDEIFQELSRVARIDIIRRTPEHMAELLAPWRVTANEAIPRWLPPETGAVPAASSLDCLVMVGALAEHD